MTFESRAAGALLALALGACDSPAPHESSPIIQANLAPGLAARYDSGVIRLQEIEEEIPAARTPACTLARTSPGGGSLEKLIPCYREVAEALAIERIVLAGVTDLQQELDALDDGFAERRNSAYLQAWYRQAADKIEPDDHEIEEYFQANQQQMGSSRRFSLSNIFYRHRDPADPDQTVNLLNEIKARIDAGETFSAIAREYSESETRLRDGLVGHLTQDKLPQPLQDITAELKAGEVSEPLLVKGGAVLIMIENVTPAVLPDLETQASGIRRLLIERKIREQADRRIADRPSPEQATVFHAQEIIDQLDAGDPDQTIFDLGKQKLSVAEFRSMVGLAGNQVAADLPPEHRQQVIASYANLERRELLLNDLLESVDPDDVSLREQAESPLRQQRLVNLVDEDPATGCLAVHRSTADAPEALLSG